MLKLGANALAMTALAAVSVVASTGAGCSGTPPTELVPGVSSQVVVPHDLQAVRVTVQANGKVVFDQGYDVSVNGTVQLPSTLGVVSGTSASTVVTITVRGYDQPCGVASDCTDTTQMMPVGTPGASHILRRSTQTFVDKRTLFVPMPLSYSCWNNNCGDGLVCKGNQCVPELTAESALVDFDPSLLDGSDVCFSPSQCFGDAPEGGFSPQYTPVLVNAEDCTYESPLPAGLGLNVRLFYQNFKWIMDPGGTYHPALQSGGEQEILNEDPIEGFTVVSDGKEAGRPQFRLAPGLCKLVHQALNPPPSPAAGGADVYITVSDIRAANLCPPKPPLLPICSGEQTNAPTLPGGVTTSDGTCNVGVPLSPTQSALYLLMDHSAVMHGAFGPMGSATALSLSLSDPVFKRTFAAFKFLPGDPAECTSATTRFTTPDIDFTLAASAQEQIATQLNAWTPTEMPGAACTTSADCPAATPVCANLTCIAPTPLELQAATRSMVGAYGHVTDFLMGKEAPNIAAVMFFVNRTPDATNDCSPPLAGQASARAALESQILAAYNATPSMQTYFVVLDDDAHDTGAPGGALDFYKQIQADLPQAVQVLDATQTTTMNAAQQAAANFAKLVTQLGTCLYDDSLPAGADLTKVQVGFTAPGMSTVVPLAPACNAANQDAVDGWNVENGRLRICGKSCDNLRNAILAASALSLQQGIPAPDVPVTATLLCGGTTPINDAGPVFPEAGTGLGADSGLGAGGDDAGGDASGSITPDGGDGGLIAVAQDAAADGP
jgi:hypothetical protein